MRLLRPLIVFALSARVAVAGLEFDALLKEAHLAADESEVTTEFHFTNPTGKVVTIRSYEAACSCMKAQVDGGKLVYQPGEKGVLRTVFDMGRFSGVVDKQVLLYLDDDPEDEPSITLTTRVHIPVLVQAEPKTVKWEVGGKVEPRVVKVTMNHSEPIRILRVSGTFDGIAHEVRTVEEGKLYELVLTPKDTGQPALGIFRIETDCVIEKHRTQQVFGVIRRSP